eukprot:TRINITY_DN7245_c0_g1_i1.p1 TRINITY_DN7245_c0_g1~~TRINITY_DN7245_c0_g1_i1.p1  ORF type:complete len:511 (+),score=87.47 TRINITY_DN7245_c0_g1_i1:53-1534(+)
MSATASKAPNRKGEEADILQAENLELKQALAKMAHENKALKMQLKHVATLLDRAKHAGLEIDNYDLVAGLELMKNFQESVVEVNTTSSVVKGDIKTSSEHPSRTENLQEQVREQKKKFTPRMEFDEHQSSVFCAKFSPDGTLVASGSFDKTVRVFDMSEKKKLKLEGHSMMISSVSWSHDGQIVASASYDSSCRLWDVSTGQEGSSFGCSKNGFMLSNVWHLTDPNIFLASHSSSSVYWYDKRAPPKPQMDLQHDCMVNTLHMLPSGQVVFGDQHGVITTIDVRMTTSSPDPTTDTSSKRESSPELSTGKNKSTSVVSSFQATTGKAQISHLSTPMTGPEANRGRFLAVNAYDNILRIYDRGSLASETEGHGKPEAAEPKLACQLNSSEFQNNGFPIESSFWVGEQAYGRLKSSEERTWEETILLATGSCGENSVAYVYDVTDMRRDSGTYLFQKLSGHTDIVYGVHCHPKLPLLLTYSADSTVKIWSNKGFT